MRGHVSETFGVDDEISLIFGQNDMHNSSSHVASSAQASSPDVSRVPFGHVGQIAAQQPLVAVAKEEAQAVLGQVYEAAAAAADHLPSLSPSMEARLSSLEKLMANLTGPMAQPNISSNRSTCSTVISMPFARNGIA